MIDPSGERYDGMTSFGAVKSFDRRKDARPGAIFIF